MWLKSLGLLLWAIYTLGCVGAHRDALTPPQPLLAPYDASRGGVAWAVVPPRNESGTTTVDSLAVGDALVAAVEEVRGIRCVPLNRTIEAMRSLKLNTITSGKEARILAKALGVDAVLVCSITAFDPYTPEMGLTAGLFARQGALGTGAEPESVNSREISAQTIDKHPDENLSFGDRAVAITSDNFDARNHQVQADVMTYASGRVRGKSALGWRKYLVSMSGFTEFAVYRTVSELLKQEWIRVGGTAASTDKFSDNHSDSRDATNQTLGRQVHRDGE